MANDIDMWHDILAIERKIKKARGVISEKFWRKQYGVALDEFAKKYILGCFMPPKKTKKRTAIFLGKGFTTPYRTKVVIEHAEGDFLTLSLAGLVIGRFERCFIKEITGRGVKQNGKQKV